MYVDSKDRRTTSQTDGFEVEKQAEELIYCMMRKSLGSDEFELRRGVILKKKNLARLFKHSIEKLPSQSGKKKRRTKADEKNNRRRYQNGVLMSQCVVETDLVLLLHQFKLCFVYEVKSSERFKKKAKQQLKIRKRTWQKHLGTK